MKKLFTLMAALMLTVTASFAQHNFYFRYKNRSVYIEPISEVDSLTFSVGSWLFQISKPVSHGATADSFEGSAKVAFNDKVKSIDVDPEVGICYSNKNSKPTYNDLKKVLGSAMQYYSFTITNVTPGTTYYYRTYVKFLDEVYYSAVNSITMGEPQYIVEGGHEFVDLGLPSGLYWARTNVGASSPSDDGDYFAWGETEPKSYYNWNNYKWDPQYGKYTEYHKTTLDDEDDVAAVNWGFPCRMPDSSEFQELYDECDWSWQGNGYIVTGPNGRTIFFPASGYRPKDGLNFHGTYGCYWSRSLCGASVRYSLNFNSDYVSPESFDDCCDGLTVRPVY